MEKIDFQFAPSFSVCTNFMTFPVALKIRSSQYTVFTSVRSCELCLEASLYRNSGITVIPNLQQRPVIR